MAKVSFLWASIFLSVKWAVGTVRSHSATTLNDRAPFPLLLGLPALTTVPRGSERRNVYKAATGDGAPLGFFPAPVRPKNQVSPASGWSPGKGRPLGGGAASLAQPLGPSTALWEPQPAHLQNGDHMFLIKGLSRGLGWGAELPTALAHCTQESYSWLVTINPRRPLLF